MDLIRYVAPFPCEEFLGVIKEEFGPEEVLVEKPQLTGLETEDNLDIVYLAKEGNRVLGTIHGTIPKACPELGGISAMCTVSEARGKGLGRMLFSKIVEELKSRGVTAMFLGTGNPVAAKLYCSFGFSFLRGSGVMARFVKGDAVDFTRERYGSPPASIQFLPGSARMRIPLIPLALHRGSQMLLDCNTGLVSCDYMTQYSCMGLYPRYLDLRKKNGCFFGAYSNTGILGAVASVLPTERGMRADFFYCDSFETAVPELLKKCETVCGECYLQLATEDKGKQRLARECGFVPRQELLYLCGPVYIPSTIWIRE